MKHIKLFNQLFEKLSTVSNTFDQTQHEEFCQAFMKYLKPFNEAISSPAEFKEELKEFCEFSLVYLIDNTAKLSVSNINDWTEYGTDNEEYHNIQLFFNKSPKWDDIKDHIIPFLIRLDRKYEVKKTYMYGFDYNGELGKVTKYKIEDLINDKLNTKPEHSISTISELSLYVEDYKQTKKSVLTKIKSFFK